MTYAFTVFGAFLVSSPWLACGLLCLRVFDRLGLHPALAIGAGGFLGYLLLGLLIWIADSLAVPVYATPTLTAIIALTLVVTTASLNIGGRRYHNRTLRSVESNFFLIIPVAIMIAPAVLALTVALELPISAWDALDHWGFNATRVADSHQQIDFKSVMTPHRHPWTVVSVHSWSLFWSQQFAVNVKSLPWFLVFFSLLLSAYGGSRQLQLSRSLSVMSAVPLITPLFMNHVVLHGYAEIWSACAVLSALAIATAAAQERSRPLCLLALALALCPIAIKNIGYVYAAISTAGTLLIVFGRQLLSTGLLKTMSRLALASLLLLFCSSVLATIFPDLAGSFAKMSFTLVLDRAYTVEFANYFYSWIHLLHALINNVSFSVVVSIILLSAYVLSTQPPSVLHIPVLLFIGCVIVSWLAIGLVQQIFLFSSPSFDTAFSRLFLPFFSIAPLVVTSLLLQVGNLAPSDH